MSTATIKRPVTKTYGKRHARQMVLGQLRKLNDKIDLRIINGESYKDLQPKHRMLVAQLKRLS